ncbi:acyl-CoA carboxylase subunit beta [Micromonospora endolithica]|uniref:Acyl-CoA carboxylase subunit beta n=1 Tax=Micromonospora endolithica TaxID=230091 RepID=A0A3A9ZG50_9ACTN|nr:carboxyl transferase domain-containing protein [Micromonospora endolithica]RKN47512.1 acyl-CoA carboxylase subunit beta [Micromonospora endolithica]TWJ21148.1 acetyl-CoA/propionyl-CoA carboxylase carboxyl transferase subunit [Micromonospora endolithica]
MTILAHEGQALTDLRDPRLRLSLLLDSGPGHEPWVTLPGDECGVVAVQGRISGAPVVAYCTDATRAGGSLSTAEADRIIDAIELAVRRDAPVIGLWHSGGAKLGDGVESMDAVGRMFAAMTRASGRVPQISVVLGPAAGAAAYGPALTDIVIMAGGARVFVTGPEVVRSVTGEQIDMAELGGSDAHGRRSGVAHLTVDTEVDACARARTLTTLLSRPLADCPVPVVGTPLGDLLPESPRRAYDVRPLVRAILDDGTGFEELQPRWAPNMVIGLGRLAGRTVGVLANNPLRKGGCLDSLSAEKAARFVRMCDSFGVPLLVLVDVPGYLPGVDQEWEGVVRRGAKLLHAFAEASVPRVTLIVRKSYGGAYIAMNSRSLGATAVFAWPQAEVAVMGAEAAVGILHRRPLAAAREDERPGLLARLTEEHQRTTGGVGRALGLGVVDAVIAPGETRDRLARAFAVAPAGRGRHGNIPL